MPTRRSLLAATLAAPFIHRAQAKDLRPVSFTLPWLADGSDAFLYLARQKGYWAEEGLDVGIVRGNGSYAAAQAVASGRFEFGFAATSSNLLLMGKGAPIIQIASIMYDSTMGISVLEDSPITNLKQLEGKRVGSTASSGDWPFIPAIAKLVPFEMSKVELVPADANVKQKLLDQGKLDAVSGFGTTVLTMYAGSPIRIRFLPYRDYGLKIYGNSLLTHRDIIDRDPELVAGLVRGLLRGLKDSMLDPDAAVDAMFAQIPEFRLVPSARTQARMGAAITSVLANDPASIEHGLGWSDPEAVAKMVAFVKEYAAEPADAAPVFDQIMTNRFVGATRLSAAEWATATAKAKEIMGTTRL